MPDDVPPPRTPPALSTLPSPDPPVATLTGTIAPDTSGQDRAIVLAVVILLGVFAIVSMVGLMWLASGGTVAATLAMFIALPSAAVGALSGILASTKTNGQAQLARGYQAALDDVHALGG